MDFDVRPYAVASVQKISDACLSLPLMSTWVVIVACLWLYSLFTAVAVLNVSLITCCIGISHSSKSSHAHCLP